jgi:hypothetical protein
MRPDHDHFSVTYRGCRSDLICMTPGFQVIVFDHVRGNISPGRLTYLPGIEYRGIDDLVSQACWRTLEIGM